MLKINSGSGLRMTLGTASLDGTHINKIQFTLLNNFIIVHRQTH